MATLETQQLDEIIVNSRRKMLTLGGAALAGLAFSSVAKAQTTALGDADYLNFALNLEYLEAQFYTLAVSGQTIDQQGVSIIGGGTAGGSVTVKSGGPTACKVPFANTLVKAYATETAGEERNHVTFLSSALSTAAVSQPNLDLVNSFNGLASLLGLGLTAFDPFADDASFLIGAYIFEDVGVTAYTGAAPLLTSNTFLDKAAGIQGVEAYHAGLIRTTIYGLDQAATTLGAAGTLMKIATAISALRAKVDGTATSATRTQADDIGLGTQQVQLNGTSNLTASSIVNATTTGSINTAAAGGTAGSLTFARTAAQVLSIVYAGGSGKGGFYPNGLNGNVK
ncbi:ferritin-like domain-containing protein [Granulicella arctica]|uniref:ferritin-like domain-containing protein n=1 Tax=Granulicella arctica TaxID=940613 RepID=UPI0021DFB133|nr:ferritin-like domain-containing protein [Granulicella arctica]